MSGADFRLLPLASSDPANEGSEKLGSLALLTLCDPEQNGNALNTDLLRELIEQLQVWRSQNIRALILRSLSEIAFSVGMNFSTFQTQSSRTGRTGQTEQSAASLYRTCLDSLYQFPAPVLCLLEKPARAGGVGLVMAADLVLATEEASLTLGEPLFGLIPANVMPYLRKRLSERRANQMVFIPEALNAETLYQWGLIDFPPLAVEPGAEQTSLPDNLEKALKKILRSVLRCNPVALARQKQFCRQLGDLPLEQQQQLAEDTLAQCLEDSAVKQGIAAFLAGDLGPWSTRPPKSFL